MAKYKDSLYPDKINDFIDNEGELSEEAKERVKEAGGLPDVSKASEGDVLKLDSEKKPVWGAISGGTKLYRHTIPLPEGMGGRLHFISDISNPIASFTDLFANYFYDTMWPIGYNRLVYGGHFIMLECIERHGPYDSLHASDILYCEKGDNNTLIVWHFVKASGSNAITAPSITVNLSETFNDTVVEL